MCVCVFVCISAACKCDTREARIAQWLECWSRELVIERSRVRVPTGVVGNFLLQGQLPVLSLILVSI